ncbi:Fur-regulated basic protein FbpA [Bacillus cereus]|nr:Fur-regulated basic protein FbpA [Bacillus cereus]
MDKQDRLIEKLIQRNIFKLADGRDLFEGSCEDLAGLLRGADEDEVCKK